MQSKLFKVSPNPANENVTINYFMKENSSAVFEVTDLQGKLLQSASSISLAGYNNYELNTSALANGIYLVKLVSAQKTLTQKLIIQH